MKKLLALFVVFMAAFMFSPQPVSAEGEAPETEEVIDYDEEVAQITADINEILAQVFTYIGGFAGISALLAFALRYIKDKGVMSKLKEEIAEVLTSNNASVETINNLMSTIQGYITRQDAFEKGIIQLISMSNLEPAMKEQVISGLNNDTISVQDVFDAGILQVQAEVAERAETEAQVKAASASLLEQLNKESETV